MTAREEAGVTARTASRRPSQQSYVAAEKGTDVSPIASISAYFKSLTNSDSRANEAARQLFCGGVAGSVAKTVTAPLSRLTILWQVHSMVTTKENRPKFAMSISGGIRKVVERGGLRSLWRGNMTSVLHRFPYSAINFYVYENTLDALNGGKTIDRTEREEKVETKRQLVRRVTKIVMLDEEDDENNAAFDSEIAAATRQNSSQTTTTTPSSVAEVAARSAPSSSRSSSDSPARHKFMAGAMAGTVACLACYPLDLIRTRLTTELEGHEHFRGIADAFKKTARKEGLMGFYSGIGPTLLVAVPNFAMSYGIYGTLKEFCLDDELFYNLRRIDADSGEPKMGFFLTVLCGACSGTLATLVTFPMDTIRRRMQIQGLHVEVAQRKTSPQLFYDLVTKEGLFSLYRGLTPEVLKVIPMVGTLFVVYEWTRDLLNVGQNGK